MTIDALIRPAPAPDDPGLADYRVVKERDTLETRGVFVAEGRLVVERLLSPSCRFGVRSLLILHDRLDALRPFLAQRAADLLRDEAPIYLADRALMDAIVGFRFHQGCLAVGRLPARDDPRGLAPALLGALPPGPATLVVLEDLVDLDNVGAVFRNSAALGARGVLLSPRCADPLYRKAVRTSMGHSLLLPFARFGRWPVDLGLLRDAGFTIGALTPAPDAQTLDAFARGAPERLERVALLLGTEGDGLTSAALGAADARVRIPMHTGVDSLNVATSLAIALHHLNAARERRSAG